MTQKANYDAEQILKSASYPEGAVTFTIGLKADPEKAKSGKSFIHSTSQVGWNRFQPIGLKGPKGGDLLLSFTLIEADGVRTSSSKQTASAVTSLIDEMRAMKKENAEIMAALQKLTQN